MSGGDSPKSGWEDGGWGKSDGSGGGWGDGGWGKIASPRGGSPWGESVWGGEREKSEERMLVDGASAFCVLRFEADCLRWFF